MPHRSDQSPATPIGVIMPPQTWIQNQAAFPSSDEPVAVVACLKPGDWVGRSQAIHEPLFDGDDTPDGPLIAFGFDHPDEIEFITANWFAKTGMPFEDLESRAFGNVWARPAEWQVVPLGVLPGMEGKPFTVLDCQDEWAAERILHHAFMKRAHEILQTPELLAAIPRRGLLICTDGRDRDDAIKRLAVIVFDQYDSGESAPITDLLFEIRDGKMAGSIRVVAQTVHLTRSPRTPRQSPIHFKLTAVPPAPQGTASGKTDSPSVRASAWCCWCSWC
jgi:hypothetical protein